MGTDRHPLFGAFALDRARGVLLRDEEPVHLRPQAYEVLNYLFDHRGRLVSKESLITHVWQGRAVSDDSLVQCLRDVRVALGAEGPHYLRTVRGRGYILDVPVAAVEVPPDAAPPVLPVAAPPIEGLTRPDPRPAPWRRAILATVAGGILVVGMSGYFGVGGGLEPADPAAAPAGPVPEAELLTMRARHHLAQTSEANHKIALGIFEQAIAADPDYAPAHAGLADAHRGLSIVGRAPSADAFSRARAAATRALELDPTLTDARVALAWVLSSFDWNWVAAERELQAAVAGARGHAEAHRAYGHLLSTVGRHEEAVRLAGQARALAPRSLISSALEAQALFYAGRLDDAEARFHRTLEMDPLYWVAHLGLGRVAILRGRLDEAVERLRKAADLSGQAPEPLTQLGYALARRGDHAEARTILAGLQGRDGYVPAYASAMIHNGLGDRDAALHFLARSVDQREVQATFIKIDTRWNWLRTDPRFVAQLERTGLD